MTEHPLEGKGDLHHGSLPRRNRGGSNFSVRPKLNSFFQPILDGATLYRVKYRRRTGSALAFVRSPDGYVAELVEKQIAPPYQALTNLFGVSDGR